MFIEDENRFVTVSIVLFPIEGESKNEIKKKKKKDNIYIYIDNGQTLVIQKIQKVQNSKNSQIEYKIIITKTGATEASYRSRSGTHRS